MMKSMVGKYDLEEGYNLEANVIFYWKSCLTFSFFEHTALNDDACEGQYSQKYHGRDDARLNRLGDKRGPCKRWQGNERPVEKEI